MRLPISLWRMWRVFLYPSDSMSLVARSILLSLSSSFTAAAARSGRLSISFRFAVSNAFARRTSTTVVNIGRVFRGEVGAGKRGRVYQPEGDIFWGRGGGALYG